MIENAYYIIRPSAELCYLAERHKPDRASFLLEPQLWHNPETSQPLRSADYTRRVKRAFIALMASVLRDDPALTLLELTPALDTTEFDRWWRIERFGGVDEELPDVEETLNLRD